MKNQETDQLSVNDTLTIEVAKETEKADPQPAEATAAEATATTVEGTTVSAGKAATAGTAANGDGKTSPTTGKVSADAAPADDTSEEVPRSLSDVINERATEDESSLKGNFRLGNILAGEMFKAAGLRKQIWLILLIVFFVILSISNRYGCQQRLIKIDKLQKELQDMRFRQLSNTSRLTQECRQANVLDKLRQLQNSELETSTQPPYMVDVPTDN